MRGGKRPGAGRKAGTKSRVTVAQKATITEIASAKGFIGDALATLASIMKDRGASASARVAAANALLDRACGKPVQAIEARVTRMPAHELGDDELAAIATRSSDGAAEAEENTSLPH